MERSYVHPNAKIGANVKINPFCYIAENVEIGDNCEIGPNATIYDYVKIGNNCKVFPGAVVGAIPQDLKFEDEISYSLLHSILLGLCGNVFTTTVSIGVGLL